jgi:hypothetical protein
MELVLKGRRAFRPYRLRTQRYAVLVAHRRCGKRSGSSLENIAACTPLFQVRRRFDGSYTGRFEFGQIASSPLSPSTMASA